MARMARPLICGEISVGSQPKRFTPRDTTKTSKGCNAVSGATNTSSPREYARIINKFAKRLRTSRRMMTIPSVAVDCTTSSRSLSRTEGSPTTINDRKENPNRERTNTEISSVCERAKYCAAYPALRRLAATTARVTSRFTARYCPLTLLIDNIAPDAAITTAPT